MCKIANLFITIFANYFDNIQRREAFAKIPLPENLSRGDPIFVESEKQFATIYYKRR